MSRSRWHLIARLSAGVAVGLLAAAPPLAAAAGEAVPAPLAEWSTDCSPGFQVAAMPQAWSFFPEQGPLTLVVRLAVDFEQLPPVDWAVVRDERGDASAELVGYPSALFQVEVRRLGETEALATVPGGLTRTAASAPTLIAWDGRDRAGRPVAPGWYEVEVRARFLPTWLEAAAEGGLAYGDLDGAPGVAEGCSRALRVEVANRPAEGEPARGVSCAGPPSSYYATVDDTSSTTLRATLHPVVDDHTRFPYTSSGTDTWDILNNADENPSNPAQLLDVYKNQAYADGCSSGCSWNREHAWPQSFGFPSESGPGRIPYTDCHHLHAGNQSYNSSRGNKPFNDCTSSCTSYPTDVNNGFGGPGQDNLGRGGSISCPGSPTSTQLWEVWEHRKGDVARSMMYMDLRYAGDSGAMGAEPDLVLTDTLGQMDCSTSSYQSPAYFGVLSTLLEWSAADPPDADEIRRNEQVWCYQGNRNPFVDHPEWVECLYLGVCTTGLAFTGISVASDLDPCAATGVEVTWTTPSEWGDGCTASCDRGFRVRRDSTQVCGGDLPATAVSCVDTPGTVGGPFSYSVEAFNDDGATSDGGASASARDGDDAAAPVISAGPTATPSATSFAVTWTTDEAADSLLEWGTAAGGPYPDSATDGAAVTSHRLDASSLVSETTYYFRACSTDPCGNGPTCSAEAAVTTSAECDPGTGTPVFVNEIHYDNDGQDTGEFIEIAGPAGFDLGAGPWRLELYNGSGGARYNTRDLSGTIADEGSGYGALAFTYPQDGIQNGAPDGIALVDGSGAVVQFLCYEGTFKATGASGAAVGMTCTDIGVRETDDPPLETSLQLTGGPGFVYQDFTWTGPTAHSRGALNTGAGQDMRCLPPPQPVQFLTATSTTGENRLEWVNPAGGAYDATVIRFRTDRYPAGPADGTELYSSAALGLSGYGSLSHTGLDNGQTYYYAAYVTGRGRTAAARTTAGIPFDASGPAKWRYFTGASALAEPGLSPGAIGAGAVYGVSNDRVLHAMNPTSSGGQWPRTAPYGWTPVVMNAPAQHRPPVVELAAGPRVFLASQDGSVYSVDAHTGASTSRSLASMLGASPVGLFADLVPGAPDLLFVGTRVSGAANTVHALVPATLAPVSALSFTNAVGQGGDGQGIGIVTGMLVDYATERVVFTSRALSGGSARTVWGLDVGGAAVSLRWWAEVGDVDGGPTLYGSRVYAGTTAGDVVALDANATGAVTPAWTWSSGDGPVKGSIWPHFGSSRLYLSTTDILWALDDNGSSAGVAWSTTSIPSPSAPLWVPGTDILLVGGGDGVLYQVEVAAGAVDRALPLGSGALGSPALDVTNGLAHVGSESGVVHAVAVPLP